MVVVVVVMVVVVVVVEVMVGLWLLLSMLWFIDAHQQNICSRRGDERKKQMRRANGNANWWGGGRGSSLIRLLSKFMQHNFKRFHRQRQARGRSSLFETWSMHTPNGPDLDSS